MQELNRNQIHEEEFALGFEKDEYLNKGFIESAQWIKNVIAKNMNEKMNREEHKEKFIASAIIKKSSTHMGIRTCARYNRGELCNLGKCHSTYREQTSYDARQRITQGSSAALDLEQAQSETRMRRNEMRLHACTLCMEALMSANGHSVLNCPWILEKNWNEDN